VLTLLVVENLINQSNIDEVDISKQFKLNLRIDFRQKDMWKIKTNLLFFSFSRQFENHLSDFTNITHIMQCE
jgi:hypothetical protein